MDGAGLHRLALPTPGGRFARSRGRGSGRALLRAFFVTVIVVAGGVARIATGWADLVALPQVEEAEWVSIQGGPAHLGTTSDGDLAPALRERWRAAVDGDGRLSPVVLAEGLAVAVATRNVVGIDPATGQVAWTLPRVEGDLIPAAIDGAAGVLVYAEGRRQNETALVGVDIGSREELWRQDLGLLGVGGPSALDGRVFVGTRAGAMVALDSTSGRELWRVETDGRVDTAPAVVGDRVFVVSENTDTGRATVYALMAAGCGTPTCEPLWRFSPSRFALNVSSPTVSDDTVYVGMGDLTVYALDAGTGRRRWDTRVRGDFSPLSSPALAGSDLLVADRLGGMYRLDAATGRWIWDYQFPTSVTFGAPLVVDGTMYVGLDDGTLAAIRLADGDLVWRTDLGTGPTAALAPADGPTGGLLLAPSIHRSGGLVALEHDPDGQLVDIPSPSELRPGTAVANFAAASAGLFVVLFLLMRFLDRRRRAGSPSGPTPEPATLPEHGAPGEGPGGERQR